MRIELSYIKKLLAEFIEADTAHISVIKLERNGFPIEDENQSGQLDEKFIFHLQILMDNQLISDYNMNLSGLESLGIHRTLGGGVTLVEKDIRLTQKGHDFANALNKHEVFEKLKTEFKDAPFKVIFDGSQKLLQHFFKKKLNDIIDE